MRLRQPHTMQKEAHLIVLHIHPGHILVLVVVRKHQDVKVEHRQEPVRSLICFFQDEISQIILRFVSISMNSVDSLGYPQTPGVNPLGQEDIFPGLHDALTIHIEFDSVWEFEI